MKNQVFKPNVIVMMNVFLELEVKVEELENRSRIMCLKLRGLRTKEEGENLYKHLEEIFSDILDSDYNETLYFQG